MGGCSGAGRVETKGGGRRWRAENPSVSTSPGESDETALLKRPRQCQAHQAEMERV